MTKSDPKGPAVTKGKGRHKRTDNQKKAPKVIREERRKLIAANLLAGLNYRDIADALNVSVGTVCSDVKIILNRLQKEQTADMDEWRLLESRRLERLLNGIWKDALAGDVGKIDRVIHIMERRARLLGLDAPIETKDVNMPDIHDLKKLTNDQLRAVVQAGPIPIPASGSPGTSEQTTG